MGCFLDARRTCQCLIESLKCVICQKETTKNLSVLLIRNVTTLMLDKQDGTTG